MPLSSFGNRSHAISWRRLIWGIIVFPSWDFLLDWISDSLLLCFSAFLLPASLPVCFSKISVFLLLQDFCFSVAPRFLFFCFSLLLCFFAFPASLLLCFPCFFASLLVYSFAVLLLCFPYVFTSYAKTISKDIVYTVNKPKSILNRPHNNPQGN